MCSSPHGMGTIALNDNNRRFRVGHLADILYG